MSEELRAALEDFCLSAECAAGCGEGISEDAAYSEILSFGGTAMASSYAKARAALRALTDAAAEPVAWMYESGAAKQVSLIQFHGRHGWAETPLYVHPPVADAAVAGEGVMPSEIAEAIRATEYKYFGDYEMSDDQREAVDVLVRFAQQYYSPPIPRPAPCEPVDLREALAMAQEVRDLLLERIQGSPARSAAHNARVRADSLIQLLSSMTPALSTLTPDTIGSHYGNGGRFDPGNGEGDGLQLVLRAARELVEAYDDPNGPAFVKINALRAALAALTRTDEAGTDGEGR